MSGDAAAMGDLPEIVRRVADLRARVLDWRGHGESVALVPTMGAIHRAHMELAAYAKSAAGRVVVSIFVNPKQFGAGEDFDSYPRGEAEDLARLAEVGVDLVFAPGLGEMYPDGFETAVSLTNITQGLCGAARVGHFDGVATVVTKLFLQCLPDIAVFGEKDFQQLRMVQRMVRDLDIPVRVEGRPTVREADGLALSSRNVYLDAAQRQQAVGLNQVLAAVAADIEAGAVPAEAIAAGQRQLAAAGLDQVEYFEIRDADTLAPIAAVTRPARLLVAAKVGTTRLIDNWPVTPPPPAG